MTQPYRIVITADAKPAIDALSSIEANSQRTADALSLATRAGVAFGIVGPAMLGVGRTAVQTADQITQLQSRLTLVTGSTAAAADVQARLFDIAQQSRVDFVELGNTYTTVARSAASMGISQERVLAVTQSIGQAMALSGGSAQGMQAALVQLSQGLGAGALRGEELNSILEQAPRLAQAMADGLGVPIGRLRALGQAGELTTDRVVAALEKAGPKLAQELGQATLTVGQSLTVLTNSATRFVGDADKATGATGSLAQAVIGLSRAVDAAGTLIRENQTAFQALALAGAGAAGLAAVGVALGGIKIAVAGIGAVLAANPVVLTLLGIGAAVGVGVSLWQARARELDTLEGKVRRLADLEAQVARNERLPAFRSSPVLEQQRAEAEALRREIEQGRAQAFRDFRAGERDSTPNPGPFPTAKAIDDARQLAKIDLDVRAKYLADRKTLEESFRQAIATESDPNRRGELERELQARQRALSAAFNKASAGPATQTSEAARYLESLQKQVLGTQELTAAERALSEIQSGRLGRVTAQQREAILGAAREIDATKEAERVAKERSDARRAEEKAIADFEREQAESRRRTLDTLLGNTATGRANALRAQLQVLNEEFQRADPDRYVILGEAIRNVEGELARLEGTAVETANSMSVFADQAARNIQTQLGDSLFDIATGNFKNIGDAWAQMLLRMLVQAQATKLNEALFGTKSSGGLDLAGLFADFFRGYSVSAPAYTSGGITGGAVLPSSLRGGAATGTNVLERDMITLLHKGEAVVPKEYNPALGGARVTVNNYAGADVKTREREDGGIDIDVLTKVVEQRIAGNVGSARGPMSSALKSRGLNSAAALPRMG